MGNKERQILAQTNCENVTKLISLGKNLKTSMGAIKEKCHSPLIG
ncbi:hypothetical protein NOC27_1373 [Nitrosococcus oceani AFC27]|nr:hypothetical protein NOC27_1373 [Nitrosococcus oceani AFC27]